MITKEIYWEKGEGKIVINIDDSDNKNVKILSISSTPNNDESRCQKITISLTDFPEIKKSFLVYQSGLISGGKADTNYNALKTIDCSVADSVLGNDKLYDGGNASE